MGDVFNVEPNYGNDFVEMSGNQLLMEQAYMNQNFLQDRPEIIGLEIFENGKPEMYSKRTFETQPRSILSGYNTFDYFYNPATETYNKSIQ